MLRSIFFDMDQTLCDTNLADQQAKTIVTKLFTQYSYKQAENITELFFAGIYKNLKNDNRKLLPANYNNEYEYRCQLLKNILSSNSNSVAKQEIIFFLAEIQKIRTKFLNFYPNVLKVLKELRKSYTLVVITNGSNYSQKAKIEKLKLNNYVDYIFIGGNYPRQKPHSSIFKLALKSTQCQANETIHIGDSLDNDIWGAFNSKIKAIWINPHKQKIPKQLTHNTWEIENFLKVPETLKLIKKKL